MGKPRKPRRKRRQLGLLSKKPQPRQRRRKKKHEPTKQKPKKQKKRLRPLKKLQRRTKLHLSKSRKTKPRMLLQPPNLPLHQPLLLSRPLLLSQPLHLSQLLHPHQSLPQRKLQRKRQLSERFWEARKVDKFFLKKNLILPYSICSRNTKIFVLSWVKGTPIELTSQNIMTLLSFVGNSKQNDHAVAVSDSDDHDNSNRTSRHYKATLVNELTSLA